MEHSQKSEILLNSGFILSISGGPHGLFLTLDELRSWTRALRIKFLEAVGFWEKPMPGGIPDEEIHLITRSFVQNLWYKMIGEIPPTVERNHERRVKKFLKLVQGILNPLTSRAVPGTRAKRRHIFNVSSNTRNIKIGTKRRRILDIFLKIQPATAREVFENSEQGMKKIAVDSIMSKFKKERIIIPE